MKNKINDFLINSKSIKIANYIITSDNDDTYILDKNKLLCKIFKYFYIVFNLIFIIATFYPYFLLASEQKENFTSMVYVIFSILASIIFFIDYLLRWITFPFRNKNSKYYISLLKFPFTGVSIILLLSMVPVFMSSFFSPNISENYINIVNVLMVFRIGRLILLLNTFYAFKIFGQIIGEQKVLLANTLLFAFVSFLIFAVIIYHIESIENPNINNYWDAFYFTIIIVTTIGFGDIVPVTDMGRLIVMIVSVIGIIIFSIPTGIIAGGVIQEIKSNGEKNKTTSKKK